MVFAITSGTSVSLSVNEDKGCVWKLIVKTFFVSLPFLTHGIETSHLSSSAHSGHFITLPDDVPWSTTALILGSILAAPVYSYIVDQYGRKIGLYILSLTQGTSCIPLFLDTNLATTISLHILAGVTSGGLFTVLPTYIREISPPGLEALMVTTMMMLMSLGHVIKWCLTKETTMFVILALVMTQVVVSLMAVESPAFLVMKGKIQTAKINLAKLTSTHESNSYVISKVEELKLESDRAREKGKLNLIGILRNPIWRDTTKIGIVLYTTITLCGSILFLNQHKILQQLKHPEDPDRTLVLFCLLGGSILCVLLVKFLERKYFLSAAYVVMVLSMGVLAVFTQAELTVTSARWLPVASLALLVAAYSVAWILPVIIMVEILNLEIRATILSLLYIYSQTIKLTHVHTFKYIEDYVGIYTLLYIFCSINLYGAVYSLFAIPNIKNKSMREIERQMKRVPLIKFNTRS